MNSSDVGTPDLNDNRPGFASCPGEMGLNDIHPISDGQSSDYPATKSSVESLTSEEFTDFSLHQAAREGALGVIKKFIKSYETQGLDVFRILDALDNEGNSVLHHAVKTNQKDVLEFLITIGAWLDLKGEDHNTPLHLAAKYNSVEAVQVLVEKGARINEQNVYGLSALHFACRRGNTKIAQVLLNHSCVDANVKDNANVTPLHQAAISGNVEIGEELIKRGGDVFAEDIEGETALHFSASEGNDAFIKLLLTNFDTNSAATNRSYSKAQINTSSEDAKLTYLDNKSNDSNTALHYASQGGYDDAVETLISHGADVNVKSHTKSTPLHLASTGGHIKAAKHLLDNGAKINARDDDQMTPLHRASIFGRLETIKLLIKRGAKVNANDKDDFTPLLLAVWKGQTESAKLLMELGAEHYLTDSQKNTCIHLAVEYDHCDTLSMLLRNGAAGLINYTDKDYRTPLHDAAFAGSVKAIKTLLENQCKVDLGDKNEKTPLHLAAENGKLQCVKLLGEAATGAINSTDDRGRMPLHLAAMNGHVRVVRSLIDMGAEIDGRDDVAWTPLDYAAQNGFNKTMKLLLDNDAPVDSADKNRNTPLHLASQNGHTDAVTLLLDYNANIALRNVDGKNCLDLAVEHFEQDVCMALIKHQRWKEVMNNFDFEGRQPMEKLIEVAPEVAEVVLDKCIERSKHPTDHPDYSIKYDFKYLTLHPDTKITRKDKWYFGPLVMTNFKREKLLSHPLTQRLILFKWGSMGRYVYYINLLVYCLFVASMTSFVVIEKDIDRRESLVKLNKTSSSTSRGSSEFVRVVPIFTLSICCLNMLKEITQTSILRWKYFKYATNYLDLALYISTFVFMFPFVSDLAGYESSVSSSVKWQAGSISILLTWINLLVFLQRFPFFGLYVLMFVEVLQTVLRLLTVFSIFIIAFALSYFLLLSEQNTFNTVWKAMVKTFVMTTGESEYDSFLTDVLEQKSSSGLPLVPYPVISYIIFTGFCLLMPIILMNLLVGLAVGDIEAVRKSAYLRILEHQVEIIRNLEVNYPQIILRWVHKPHLIIFPNQLPILERFRTWLGYDDGQFDFLKKEQSEGMAREEETQRRLTAQQSELKKQKKTMKQLSQQMDHQSELLKKIAARLGIDEDLET